MAVKKRRMTKKQQEFVKAYLGPAGGNGSKAAATAGYSEPYNVTGSKALASVNVSNAIAKAKAAINPEELVEDWKREAGLDVFDFIHVNPDGSFQFDLQAAKEKGLGRHLTVEHDRETGAPIVKIESRQAARDKLTKIAGLYKGSEEPQTPDVRVGVLLQLSRDEYRARALKVLRGEDEGE